MEHAQAARLDARQRGEPRLMRVEDDARRLLARGVDRAVEGDRGALYRTLPL